jgi:hypothetical protein
MSFQGSCHCGAVTFTVDAELPEKALSCNCSICRRKGSLLAFFPVDAFTLNSGQDRLTTYLFNSRQIHHQFCQVCGSEAFAHAKTPDGNQMYAINLRCVPDLDLDKLQIRHHDGASL